MGFERLTCPHCGYALEPGNNRVLLCPRCNGTVELESDCFGSCLSCRHASKAGSCATTDAGLTEDPLSSYKSGELILCIVKKNETGGYAVEAGNERLPGFVATNMQLRDGQSIQAVVVCIHKGRLLLSLPA